MKNDFYSQNVNKNSKMPKFYAVKAGHKSGIYNTWAECQVQTKGFSGAIFKSFTSLGEATDFIRVLKEEKVDNIFFTDGSFRDGRCGAAAVDTLNKRVYYCSVDGIKSNNRGELTGIILALENSRGSLKICTDSQISINIIVHGYEAKANLDLLEHIKGLMKDRIVVFEKVLAHSGIHFNEMADRYADKATTVQAGKTFIEAV